MVPASAGIPFEDGPDYGRILVSGRESGGRYALMSYTVAARPSLTDGGEPAFGPHRHEEIEETFFVRRGRLRFLLGEAEFDLAEGDFVRVPPGTRHGFANLTGAEVELLVSFHPGGFEELFLTYRSDQNPPPDPNGFIEEAARRFASEFETE